MSAFAQSIKSGIKLCPSRGKSPRGGPLVKELDLILKYGPEVLSVMPKVHHSSGLSGEITSEGRRHQCVGKANSSKKLDAVIGLM